LKYSKEHIVEAIRQRKDREVLAAMYREIYPKVARYVTGNSGSEDDSKDVFQEAILVFYQLVITERYNRIQDITGFLIKVSRNIWINKVKRTKKEVSVELLAEHEDYAPSPLISMIMNEKWSAYHILFNNLGSKCREMLTYSIYQKLSMKEIALKMSLSNENAAKTQNYRCKQKLMEIVSANKDLKDLLKS